MAELGLGVGRELEDAFGASSGDLRVLAKKEVMPRQKI